MKKILAVFLSALLVFALTACDSSDVETAINTADYLLSESASSDAEDAENESAEENTPSEETVQNEVSDEENEPAETDQYNTEEETSETSVPEESSADAAAETDESPESTLTFRNDDLLNQHYQKHGIEMGFDSAEAYEAAAAKVVSNPEALHKTEAEDGDDIYYVESTNEFVVVSVDGYIRTYFYPSAGKSYYDRQ